MRQHRFPSARSCPVASPSPAANGIALFRRRWSGYSALFGQETTLEQQFNNPGTRCLCPQTIGRTEDLFQIFILHKARDPGHRRKQCCIGKMARRLGLPLYHFTFSHSNSSPFATTGSGVPSFSSSRSLLPNSVRQPASARKTRFSDKFAFGNVQFDNTLAEHRIRAELHQILTGNQVIDLRFVLRQVDRRTPCGRNDGVVRIDLLSSQQRLRISGSTTGCGNGSGA